MHVHAQPAGLRATLAALDGLDVLLLPDSPDAETEAALGALDLLQSRGAAIGPPACLNRLAVANDARVVVLLESGCVPAPGWLEALLDALQHAGLAGPSTNRAWNEQASAPIPGEVRSLAPLHGLADFCLAIRRDVLDAVGAADEGFGLGPCWEMEYTARALRAGFSAVWACGAYVERAPFTARRAREERARMRMAKQRYQDAVCALRLTGARADYEDHCRGEACEHFAPAALMTIHRPLPRRATAPSRPPLVSCIMPTGDRPEFARAAIDALRRQDHTEWELVIVDGGTVALEVPDDPRVRVLRGGPGEPIGSKRNRAVEAARGEFIVHWDDDDVYAPARLRRQLEPLLRNTADITALRAGVFLELDPWACWEVTPELHRRLFVEDVHGGTLAYRRSVWEHTRFPAVSLAEDAAFLRTAVRRGARLERLDNDGLFVYVRHRTCAWQFRCGSYLDPSGWRRVAPPAGLPPHLAPRPLVSAIMPTADRRAHVARALEYFARQDHAASELIVIDDGADRVGDLMPPGVRYVECDPLPLGAKRNLACELTRGEVIVHWDDDDWSSPKRLSYQLSQLGTADVCGADRLLFLDAARGESWLYSYGGRRPWAIGTTLCYTADTWRRRAFPPVDVGEDSRFVAGRRVRVTADHAYVVAIMHAANSSPKRTEGSWWSRVPLSEVADVLGADLSHYTEYYVDDSLLYGDKLA